MPGNAGSAMERDLLARLTDRWAGRVTVKRDELDLDGHFDPELPDFPVELVPLARLGEYAAADREARYRVLAAAWIGYNAKTSAVEQEIILPACRMMLQERFPGRSDDITTRALHQTIIDEHYHVLMCLNAAGVTRRRRKLHELRFAADGWSVVRMIRKRQREVSAKEADLVSLAYSLAAETSISSFLSAVSPDAPIQPMNRLTVEFHRQDENGHAPIFRELVGAIYRELGREERSLFDEALMDGLRAFREPDDEPWRAIAAVGGLSLGEGELADLVAGSGPELPDDTGPWRTLLAELRSAPLTE
jgi:hypothetical protein